MNTIHRVLLTISASLALVSCGLIRSNHISTSDFSKISPGMSKEDVIKVLNLPNFRRFRVETDTEELEFLRNINNGTHSVYTRIIITLNKGRVVRLDSRPYETRATQSASTPRPIIFSPHSPIYGATPQQKIGERATPFYMGDVSDEEFERIYQKAKSFSFDSDQIDYLRTVADWTHITCAQCIRLLELKSFDSDKIAILKLFANRLSDKYNYHEIVSIFSFSSEREEVKKILGMK